MPAAGDLRARITFAERAAVSDGYGNTQGAFEDQFTAWAQIRPRLGGEQVLASRLAGTNLATITLRYSSDTARITTDWRATDARSGEVWNIRSIVDPDQRRRHIELLCEKGVAT